MAKMYKTRTQQLGADLLCTVNLDQAVFAEEGHRDLRAKVHGRSGPLLGWTLYPHFIDEEPNAPRG